MNFGTTEIILIGVLLAPLVARIFYYVTLQNTIKEVRIENRTIQPYQVWLALIPLFGLVWEFIIVARVADSLKNEFEDRSVMLEEVRPGYSVGLIYCILSCCIIIPIVGGIALIAAIICWIIYWTKVYGYKAILQNM